MLKIINRYTCRIDQLKQFTGQLKHKGFIPIIGKGNENIKNKHNNYIEMRKVIEENPNNMFALKFSSLGIDNDTLTTMEWSRNILKTTVKNNSIMTIDLEHAYQNHRIVYLTDRLMSEFNNNKPIIYKTYQMYRKDSLDMLSYDLTKDRDYVLGIKLVRGAYYNSDKRTQELFANIEDTHKSYNKGIDVFVDNCKPEDRMICATHNYDSIEYAKKLIDENQLENISFAQLMGMSDNYSEKLAKDGYVVYKYLPYGNFIETIPYLLRRLYENYPLLIKLFH